jgi:hypothetical protein
VKTRFTHKELTLLIGILVAAIILIILWLHPSGLEASEAGKVASPDWQLPSMRILTQKVLLLFQLR